MPNQPLPELPDERNDRSNGHPTVLFVDDDPNLLTGLTRALRRRPFRILTADSAERGLETLTREAIDIVVSDERMPGTSGTEFLAKVRKRYPTATRILLTGQASLEAAITAINEGEIFRFITKPCDPATLTSVLEQAASHRQLMIAARRLLRKSNEQARIIKRLEQENPGITQLHIDGDGAIVLTENEASLEQLLDEMES